MAGNADAPVHPHHPVGFNLAAIAVVLGLVGIGAAYLLDAAGRDARISAHRSDTETALTRSLGGTELEIPLSWFRYEEQRIEGFAKQIDLRFDLPLGEADALVPVDITLLPRSRVRPSAKLLDGVYLHQFGDAQLNGPPGLVGKPLLPSEGYAGESVWYDALSIDPFVAKCSEVVPGGPSQCLRTVYLGPGIGAVYTFPEAALAHWKSFDATVGERLKRIGAL